MTMIASRKPQRVFLKGGEVFLSRTPAVVTTVLGSCLALTIYSRSSSLGAICHVMLPSGSIDEGFKYVDSTFDYMARKIEKLGIEIKSCEIKLFGGSTVLVHNPTRAGSVGERNVSAACQKLESWGVAAKACDLGGDQGRKLYFNTNTGEVFVRKVRNHQDELLGYHHRER